MNLPTEGRVTLQAAAGATGNGTVLSVIGYGAAVLQVSGTFVGTVTFEASVNESDFVAIRVVNMGTGGLSTTATAPGLYYVAAAGLRLVRARVSAWTSGTITVEGGRVALGNAWIDQGVAAQFVDENGTAYGIKHTNNQIRSIMTPYQYQIAEGNITGHTAVRRFGRNGDVGTAAETLSAISTLMYYPASAEILKIKSDDVDDDGDPVDTGARTVWIQGLDDDYAIITDTITTNGTTAVDSNVAFLRCFKAMVMTAGSSGTNEGTITVYGNNGTSKILAISPTKNESHEATYTVPAGQTMYVSYLVMSEASLKGSTFGLHMRPFGGLFYTKREFPLLGAPLVLDIHEPLPVAKKTDVEMRVTGILAGAVASGGFLGWREDN